MIIVPELETVVILTPRTGSTALRDALLSTYPRAMMLYRHMEADGVPRGYDRWRRVGVVREPIARLWSLYRYLKTIGEGKEADGTGKWEPSYVARQRASVELRFADWIIRNQLVFTSPYDQVDGARFYPGFAVGHAIPENRKSQFIYLRPDLGTVIYRYDEAEKLFDELGVKPEVRNAAPGGDQPFLNLEAIQHVRRFFAWDNEASRAP